MSSDGHGKGSDTTAVAVVVLYQHNLACGHSGFVGSTISGGSCWCPTCMDYVGVVAAVLPSDSPQAVAPEKTSESSG